MTLRYSVVVTNYNYLAYVAEAVDSALAQSLPPHEVIVVDDGSTDGSAAFLEQRYGAHPTVRLLLGSNGGQLSGFARGTAAASGDVVCFLDADDLWEAGYLAALDAVYGARKDVDFIYVNMRFFGSREGLFHPEPKQRDLGLSILAGAFLGRWQASATSGNSLRIHIARQLLEVPPEMCARWRTRADDCIVLGAEIAGARKFYLPEPLTRYRAHGSNTWLNQGRDPVANLKHWLRVESMLAFYRERFGLGSSAKVDLLRHAKLEFRTKPSPTWEDFTVYRRLVWGSSLTPYVKLEHTVSMFSYYLKRLGK